MRLQEYLVLREKLATWLFEHLDDVPSYVEARLEADAVLARLVKDPP